MTNRYKKVIVFSPQLAIFIAGFLKKHYRNRYIIDYRDLSIEQKKPFDVIFKKVLSNSFANVISSPGFQTYLPKEFKYYVSHNFHMEAKQNSIPFFNNQNDIKILTIGAIREDCNREVMDALGNKEGYQLAFVGKGIASQALENYAKQNGYKNILFTGYYKKTDEPDIINDSTMINIVYPLIPSHITALSNRFYNSLKYKRPMVVTKNTIQGNYAEKYRVGLVIDDCDNLADRIKHYLGQLDISAYCKHCDELLSKFSEENKVFEELIMKFAST